MSEKVTIYTLANELNMSVSAVSRAFNPNTRLAPEKRKIILEAAKKAGYRQNKMASRLSQDPIRIGILICKRIELFYSQVLSGVESAVNDFSNFKLTCDIRTLSIENYNTESACSILNEFKEAGYDGIIIQGMYNITISNKINELADSGIKVVTLHNDLPDSKRLFTSTMDTEVAGAMVAELFDMVLPRTRRNVIVFSGPMLSIVHQGLISSYIRHADAYKLKLLKHYDTADLPKNAEKMVKEAFSKYPEVNGIYISSSNSIPICQYLEDNGLSNKIFVIASDIFKELNAYIYKGVVNATIYQSPSSQGYSAVESLYYSIAESKEIPDRLLAKPQVVFSSNLSLYNI